MIKNFVIAVLLVVVILFLITNPTYKSSGLSEIPTNYALFELYGYVKRENVNYEKTLTYKRHSISKWTLI